MKNNCVKNDAVKNDLNFLGKKFLKKFEIRVNTKKLEPVVDVRSKHCATARQNKVLPEYKTHFNSFDLHRNSS